MEYRTVNKSSFIFETDLPPSSRAIHPSGILHAFRSTPDVANSSSSSSRGREEQAFAWITNSLHIEAALSHLEKRGFDHCQVFIPYSTKRNWCDRYPHAADLALECTERGKCLVDGATSDDRTTNDDDFYGTAPRIRKRKRKRQQSQLADLLRDESHPYLPDAERDELHVEIYNYFWWLHAKFERLENKNSAGDASSEREAKDEEGIDDDGEEARSATPARGEKTQTQAKKSSSVDVDIAQLKGVLDKLESSFAIIPRVKLEMQDMIDKQQERDAQQYEKVGEDAQNRQRRQLRSQSQAASARKGPPFLEEALSLELSRLVKARERAGEPKRRSRKRVYEKKHPNRISKPADFDDLFRRLTQYKEEHGDCLVPKKYPKDHKLAIFVKDIRYKKKLLADRGLECAEEPAIYSSKTSGRLLTAERIQRLNSLGFVWNAATGAPKVPWEGRFRQCVEYYEANGKWPTQSMGTLGLWVHRARQLYAKCDANFMKSKAPKLDEVGFEWTPRGNTRMSWDEGFEMLMEYGRINGHYDVPSPSATSEEVDKKFYRWVQSLHSMYRSYKLGRQHGSLTDDRVVLLIQHGFVFRDDLD